MGKSSEKRKDNKGRILLNGEQQKSTGQYEYRYYDIYNVRRSIYSWRLTASDPTPKGKKYCEPLRVMEERIERDKHNGIDTYTSRKATLNERFDIYMKSKINLKPSTRQNYVYMYDKYVRPSIGRMEISMINYSMVQEFYNGFITEMGFKPNSMESVHTVMNPVFEAAVADNIIRTNPCLMAMKKIRSSAGWEGKKVTTKNAMTADQQKLFVNHLRNDNSYARWVNILTVMLGTGLRIGECTGLVWSDCDFSKNTISVRRTLVYRKWEDGSCAYKVMPMPKTVSGIRTIPMLPEVREALLAERERQDQVGTAGTVIDGVGDWVFTNRYGTVLSAKSVNRAIFRIIREYNRLESETAINENREPELIPHMTNHQMRHSFCTRMMEESCKPDSQLNLKVIQVIMGHANSSTTLDIYTDVSEKFKQESMLNIQDSIYLG